jgi:hypothetical protein
MPDDVAANCDEAGLPNGVRVFVADLYVPKSLAIAGAGNNCIVHPSSRTSIAGFATFNSPWFPMSTVGPTAPSPFYAGGIQYNVPTMRLAGIGLVESIAGTRVVRVNFRDLRYGLLLFPDGPTASNAEAATRGLLAETDYGNLLWNESKPLAQLQLALPKFRIETRRRSKSSVPALQFADVTTLVDVHETGLGNAPDWPRLLHSRLRVGKVSPGTTSISINRSFYFAIVRFDTRSVLLVGYVAHPTVGG